MFFQELILLLIQYILYLFWFMDSQWTNNQNANKESVATRALDMAQAGLNFSYSKIAGTWLRIFWCMWLAYVMTQEVITKHILAEQFLVASWLNIIIFYLIIAFVWMVIYILFDVVKDLLLYVFR